ncbi:50S ribosomal protein L30 [bacterium]|nr:50S ribosomal protein L30 [bacterium]MBU0899793.1 50S ribosomal protein L30 [bacterium]MBU1153613.1 50S ribosomal protein L30 [bacterium]MBU1782610.1 50S ribosomal protein L30 [bacterium]MBU2600250.1 50S ribosomal protein L30 [bacterium]
MKKIKVTLERGLAGKINKHKRTILALGLKYPHCQVIKEDNPVIRGMIRKVSYLVKVEEVKE